MRFVLFSLAVICMAAPASAADCDRAPNPVEQAICADAGLQKLDRELNSAWAMRRQGISELELKAVLAEQRAWLGRRARDCKLPPTGTLRAGGLKRAADCLSDQYRLRIAVLKGTSTPAKAPPPSVDPTELHRAWLVNNRCQTLDYAGSAVLAEAHSAVLAGVSADAWPGVRDTATAGAKDIECNKADQTAFVKTMVIKLGEMK